MAELEHSDPIRVRLEWADGSIYTMDGTLDGVTVEWFQEDAYGKDHRFEKSGVIDADGYHIFKE